MYIISHEIVARSLWYPITGIQFELFVIGYPRDSHVNYVHFNGFFRNVSRSFQSFWILPQKKFLKDIFNSKICYRYD